MADLDSGNLKEREELLISDYMITQAGHNSWSGLLTFLWLVPKRAMIINQI
jgi:hypothetical protein